MTNYKISNKKPLPRGIGKYPLAKMKAGENFYTDGTEKARVRSAIQAYQKKHPRKRFVTAMEGAKIFVWRQK